MVPFSIKKKQLFKTTIAFLWLCLFFCSFANAEIQKGKTGIESLDTLPVYEWDIKTENRSLPLTLLQDVVIPTRASMFFAFLNPCRYALSNIVSNIIRITSSSISNVVSSESLLLYSILYI